MLDVLAVFSRWAMPLMMMVIPLYGLCKGIDVYGTFVEGAQEGLHIAVRILPYVLAIFFAFSLFRNSGALVALVTPLTPFMEALGIPSEVLPMLIVRPLSGGASFGLLAELLPQHGVDSLVGRLAATMQGATDTTFYVITLYFGSIGIKRIRHAVPAALIGDLCGFLMATYICTVLFTP